MKKISVILSTLLILSLGLGIYNYVSIRQIKVEREFEQSFQDAKIRIDYLGNIYDRYFDKLEEIQSPEKRTKAIEVFFRLLRYLDQAYNALFNYDFNEVDKVLENTVNTLEELYELFRK